MKKLLLLALVAGQLVFTGCTKNDSDCPYSLTSGKAPAIEIAAVQAYITSNSITATQHSSGIFYEIVSGGTGSTATACSYVTVQYTGKLTNGTVFDSSPTPVRFALSRLIPGWQIGIPLIKGGGYIRLYIPPSLAYGSTGSGSVPPNSILIFDIDLKSVD